ncbi:hypothetical protein PENSPDRAFT_695209 [Peniophora sp. CONT]|nr:hypothetical protein PENSPDRAFT_695209 [Peniophora sp. CONT]
MLLIAVLSSLVLASLLSWGAFEALRLAFHLGPQLLADAWRFALASPETALIALVAIPAGGAFVTLLTLAAILSVLGAGKFAFIASTQLARTRWEHFLAPE